MSAAPTVIVTDQADRGVEHAGHLQLPDRPRRSASAMLQAWLQQVRAWHGPLVWFALLTGVWALVCVVGLVADPRLLAGAPIWAKPLKFSVSLGVYALTLAWMLSLVHRPRLRRVGWWAGTIGAAASLLEIVAISVQVVRGTASHFNVSTPVDAALYGLMGGAVVFMYCATLVIGVALVVLTRLEDRSLAWALRLGLLIGLAGLSVGFLMVIPTAQQLAAGGTTIGSHSVGGDDAGGGLFFLGWNTVHGDLRVAHFVGMHALQGLPLLALGLATLTRGRVAASTRLRLVLLASAAWAALTALLLWQALRGQSVVHPDGLTWTAVGALLLAGAAAGAGVLHHHRLHRPERSTGPGATVIAHVPVGVSGR